MCPFSVEKAGEIFSFSEHSLSHFTKRMRASVFWGVAKQVVFQSPP